MPKKPEIEHDYHPKKDRLEITIHGYGLKSKKSRNALMKQIIIELERNPDRLIVDARKQSKTKKEKKLPGSRRDGRDLEEIGD